ncbi:hypothetical protein BN159_5323 [Streptomyces davaonensis JCM 4913]|uniref:Uncharacterized protein n=1 Tax=Streptomyces davaonensis (strain DSM 101723 / JCM 4913 / KCC S-0913 / 768) TaxID=1214101 RepID=K4R976_STRDJ|nr:hypothetical protein [Streptomyces davaonensis]CCK29702.1 hypothetical protein BN159_5323 [Streptomyces davaonensis JCM 4913]
MKNWREDAQPEWPEAASGTQVTPTGNTGQGGTQAFPATAANAVPTDADATAVLPKLTPTDGSTDQDRPDLTELLSAFDRFERTDALSTDGERKAPSARKPRVGGEAFTPRERSPRAEGGTPQPGRDPFPPVGDGTRVASASAPARDPFPPVGGSTRVTPAVPRDPWDESAAGDGSLTHDPHEVTIQLDGVGLQLDGSLRAAKSAPGGGGADGSDGPVFVDESGRRSRRFRRLGIVVGIACAVYAVVIVATLLSGNSNAPWLPVQDPAQENPAGKVDTPPLPAESAPSAGADGVTPGASPSVSDGATPSPGSSATAPDASTTAEEPGTTADPEPTATKKPTSKPGTDPTTDPDPTDPPTTPDPEPTATDTGEPTPDPTATDGGGDTAGTGTDTVAAGPLPNSPASPYDPSPEHTL